MVFLSMSLIVPMSTLGTVVVDSYFTGDCKQNINIGLLFITYQYINILIEISNDLSKFISKIDYHTRY